MGNPLLGFLNQMPQTNGANGMRRSNYSAENKIG